MRCMMKERLLSAVTFAMRPHSPVPVYRQLYNQTRAAIASGQLRSGERLPSTRSLAAQIGAARGTVDAAYAMLAAEGWIVARGPAGTVVAPDLVEKLRGWESAATAAPPGASNRLAAEMAPRRFQMGLPALDAFPRKLWSRLVAREARVLSSAGMANRDPAGYGKLRESIAAYLAIARGVSCTPRQVFVTAGYQGALSLVARTLIERGNQVWFENPGYHLARQGLSEAGACLIPVPVDNEGMRIAEGLARAPRAGFAV